MATCLIEEVKNNKLQLECVYRQSGQREICDML